MTHWNKTLQVSLFAATLSFTSQTLNGQALPLAWNATKYFQYNIERINVSGSTVKVVFSVTNPSSTTGQVWNILTDAPWKGGGASSLRVDVGWDPIEYTNTGSNNVSLNPISPATPGTGAAYPIQINALGGPTPAKACTLSDCGATPANRFFVTTTVSPLAFPQGRTPTTGTAVIEGHPACVFPVSAGCPAPLVNPTTGTITYANVPVKSVFQCFSLATGTKVSSPRRQIVDIAKCKVCHDNGVHNGTTIPRLALHGGNRNEDLGVCVVCHNPDQTDIPYRTSGPEVSVDFKRMVHSIHSGGFRQTPFIVIGFNGSVNDFSAVRFPAELRNCLNCHIETNGRGSFELPLQNIVLGSTINTGSVVSTTSRSIDVNPFNDLKITPTAAACSGCHDSAEVQSHMIRTGGASFSILQQNIIPGVTERCVDCHGPGKEEDVRRAHEIGGSGVDR